MLPAPLRLYFMKRPGGEAVKRVMEMPNGHRIPKPARQAICTARSTSSLWLELFQESETHGFVV